MGEDLAWGVIWLWERKRGIMFTIRHIDEL